MPIIPGLQVMLDFWQIKIWTHARLDQCLGVVEEKQSKIEDRRRNWLVINKDMLFNKMPPSRSTIKNNVYRTRRVATLPFSLYVFPFGMVRDIFLHVASLKLTWPSIQLVQVGELESTKHVKIQMKPSKSAINCVAPLFNALIIILQSTGPVISTRRSIKPGAGLAPTQMGSFRMYSVSVGKVGLHPEFIF